MTEPDRADAAGIRTLIILGATGDLTGRLLLPGLASLVARDHLGTLMLVGSGSSDWTDEQWQERVRESCAEAAHDSDDDGRNALHEMIERSRYQQADVTAPGALAELIGGA